MRMNGQVNGSRQEFLFQLLGKKSLPHQFAESNINEAITLRLDDPYLCVRPCGSQQIFHVVCLPQSKCASSGTNNNFALHILLPGPFIANIRPRSEERRVGKEWVSTGRSRWWPGT